MLELLGAEEPSLSEFVMELLAKHISAGERVGLRGQLGTDTERGWGTGDL